MFKYDNVHNIFYLTDVLISFSVSQIYC